MACRTSCFIRFSSSGVGGRDGIAGDGDIPDFQRQSRSIVKCAVSQDDIIGCAGLAEYQGKWEEKGCEAGHGWRLSVISYRLLVVGFVTILLIMNQID